MNDPLVEPNTPDDIVDAALRLLSRGVADRRAAFHTPILATVGLDGRPRARTVVLRGFDVAARALRVHTDVRSDKVAEVREDPRVSFAFYDVGARLQVRVEARASVHIGDETAAAAWARSSPMARACYAGDEVPGALLLAPPAERPAGEGDFALFCVLLCRFESLDILSLRATGHRRVLARWEGQGRILQWLAP